LAGNIYPEIREQLHSCGFISIYDYFDWWIDSPSVFDRIIKGVPVGKFTLIGVGYRYFYAIKSIGRYTSINGTFICSHNHPLKMLSTSNEFRAKKIFAPDWQQKYEEKRALEEIEGRVSIGNDVWIGANVFVNASTVTEIGDGAVIGAGSVVTHDIPPYAIAYGVPARVHRYRYSPEEIEILLRVKWWDWDDEKMRENAELFIYPEKFFEKFR
jgi:aminocyclitol acetyltransferase